MASLSFILEWIFGRSSTKVRLASFCFLHFFSSSFYFFSRCWVEPGRSLQHFRIVHWICIKSPQPTFFNTLIELGHHDWSRRAENVNWNRKILNPLFMLKLTSGGWQSFKRFFAADGKFLNCYSPPFGSTSSRSSLRVFSAPHIYSPSTVDLNSFITQMVPNSCFVIFWKLSAW